MKQLLISILIFTLNLTYGQSFTYPEINFSGKQIFNLVPNNWMILDSAQGDLNNDKHDDIALIFQYRDSVSIVKTNEGYSDTLITQPRVLTVFFYNNKTKQYELVQQSNTFILNHDDPNMEDPFQDISISKGLLEIDFKIFMNAGGWGTNNNSYKFRYQDKQFKLIGVDYYYLNRATGETEDRSYNFLAKKIKITTGNISSDIVHTRWRSFKILKLKTLNTLTQPFTWEVEKDFFL